MNCQERGELGLNHFVLRALHKVIRQPLQSSLNGMLFSIDFFGSFGCACADLRRLSLPIFVMPYDVSTTHAPAQKHAASCSRLEYFLHLQPQSYTFHTRLFRAYPPERKSIGNGMLFCARLGVGHSALPELCSSQVRHSQLRCPIVSHSTSDVYEHYVVLSL